MPVKHGLTKTPEYCAWIEMRRRCLKPNRKEYPHYGGRGITICDRWLNSFVNFLADMGRRPAGLTLERKDVNGGYTPENCEWATIEKQNRNRTINIPVVIDGVTKNLGEWCEQYRTPYWLVVRRIRRFKWPALQALTTPSLGSGGSHRRPSA